MLTKFSEDLDWDNNGLAHIDVWTNSAWDEDTTSCEYALTPGSSQSVIRDPNNDLIVDCKYTPPPDEGTTIQWHQLTVSAAEYLYNDDGTCGNTYANDSASDYCDDDDQGGGDSSASFCESGCSWAGHCIGTYSLLIGSLANEGPFSDH